MFRSLIKFNSSSKFFKKCKSAIKCTRKRLDGLRKRNQAIVKFSKQDVADLIAKGSESDAFARIDVLIVDMNQVSCYDMIEKCCNRILKQLKHMEKESECPQEALEAVSTLIFAAARFSGLPELCDLRDILKERYGSSFDSFVNPKFAQNVENKSFTSKEKLRVMERIAKKFSVPFDSRALETKINCGSQHKHDLPKNLEALARDGHKADGHAVHERKSKAMPEVNEQKKETKVKTLEKQETDSARNGKVGNKAPPCSKFYRASMGGKPVAEKTEKATDMRPSYAKPNLEKHFVKPKFVQNFENRSLTDKEKLRVMKRIAKEFSVPFDSRALETKITCGSQDKHDLPKKGSFKQPFEALTRDEHKGDGHAVHERKSKAMPEGNEQKKEMDGKTLEKQETDSARPLNGKAGNKAPPCSKPYRASMGGKPVPEKATNMRPSCDVKEDARPFHRIRSGRGGQQRSRRNVSPSDSGYYGDSGTEDRESSDGGGCGGWFRQTSARNPRKHRSRSAAGRRRGGRDEEEKKKMDKLLMHCINLVQMELENRRKKKGQVQPSESEA